MSENICNVAAFSGFLFVYFFIFDFITLLQFPD